MKNYQSIQSNQSIQSIQSNQSVINSINSINSNNNQFNQFDFVFSIFSVFFSFFFLLYFTNLNLLESISLTLLTTSCLPLFCCSSFCFLQPTGWRKGPTEAITGRIAKRANEVILTVLTATVLFLRFFFFSSQSLPVEKTDSKKNSKGSKKNKNN